MGANGGKWPFFAGRIYNLLLLKDFYDGVFSEGLRNFFRGLPTIMGTKSEIRRLFVVMY